MKEGFREYLKIIDVPDYLVSRIDNIIGQFFSLLDADIEHMFLTDGYDSEGKRSYGNLSLIASDFLMECKNIESQENIDFVKLSGGLGYINVSKSDYDMK